MRVECTWQWCPKEKSDICLLLQHGTVTDTQKEDVYLVQVCVRKARDYKWDCFWEARYHPNSENPKWIFAKETTNKGICPPLEKYPNDNRSATIVEDDEGQTLHVYLNVAGASRSFSIRVNEEGPYVETSGNHNAVQIKFGKAPIEPFCWIAQ